MPAFVTSNETEDRRLVGFLFVYSDVYKLMFSMRWRISFCFRSVWTTFLSMMSRSFITPFIGTLWAETSFLRIVEIRSWLVMHLCLNNFGYQPLNLFGCSQLVSLNYLVDIGLICPSSKEVKTIILQQYNLRVNHFFFSYYSYHEFKEEGVLSWKQWQMETKHPPKNAVSEPKLTCTQEYETPNRSWYCQREFVHDDHKVINQGRVVMVPIIDLNSNQTSW